MDHLTTIEGVPDSADVLAGMAHFAGSGPLATTCGQCVHRGVYRDSRRYNKKTGMYEDRRTRTGGCAMFKKLTGKYGPPVSKGWTSCKYFENKPTQ